MDANQGVAVPISVSLASHASWSLPPTCGGLFLCAKHLFVEAMLAGADISNGDGQNTSRSWSQDQRLLEMPKVGPGHDAGARTRRAYFAAPARM